jgi:hypothetical protein
MSLTLSRLSYDKTTIPTDLLDLMKSHSRVDFSDDDTYLESTLARAIQLIERTTAFAIAPATWLYDPVAYALYAGVCPGGAEGSNRCASGCTILGFADQPGWQLPVGPVSGFTAILSPDDGTADQDVTALLSLAGTSDPSQYQRQWLVINAGASLVPGTLKVTLTTGFASGAVVEPSIEDIILRLAAYLYENREFASLPGFDIEVYANSLTTGLWRPVA